MLAAKKNSARFYMSPDWRNNCRKVFLIEYRIAVFNLEKWTIAGWNNNKGTSKNSKFQTKRGASKKWWRSI